MIYLDNNATTRIAPEVLDEINNSLQHHWGNPSSHYSFGNREIQNIENSRYSIASLLGCQSDEILFTSCATESNNTAFNSAINACKDKKHIITSLVEHSSVLNIVKHLSQKGYKITYLDVDKNGNISLQQLEDSITPDTCLVSLMWANNETGVIFPVKKISTICKAKNVLFHSDAVQATGKIPIDMSSLHIDYLSLSAHKIYGPKGVGALYIKSSAPKYPFIIGGGQEKNLRGGTYNTPYIAGFSKAAELSLNYIEQYHTNIKLLRDYFENRLISEVPGSYINGAQSIRLPNTSNIGISGIDSDLLVTYLEQFDILVSSGSACTSKSITPSHVINAMKGYNIANEALRISLSIFSTKEEINRLIETLHKASKILK